MTSNPHALNNLPPLEVWTAEALLRDYTVNIELDIARQYLDMSPNTARLRAEILRRMKEGGRP